MYTSHGHYIPGTTNDGEPPNEVARCRGVKGCKVCMTDAADIVGRMQNHVRPDDMMGVYDALEMDTNYVVRARAFVRAYILQQYASSSPFPNVLAPNFEVHCVWFAKVLKNWKALITTSMSDGRYYEVTHNAEKNETYIDVYGKIKNVVVPG